MLIILRYRRRKRGLSQSDLAKRIRKSKSYVSRMERKMDGYEPTFDLIKKMAKELECCPIELFVYFADIDCKYFRGNKKSNQ